MTRARVHFLLEDLIVEAPVGTPLQAIADASGADITFGCRSGSCGTCRVQIAEQEHCSPPNSEERDFLAALGGLPEERLACQVRVLGDIQVEYLGI